MSQHGKNLFLLIAVVFSSSSVWANWSLFEETSIDGTTSSISSGDVLKTTSGNVYQITSGYEYEYEYRPDLIVLTNGYKYRLIIEGFDEKFTADCLTCSTGGSNWDVFEDTSIDGRVTKVSYGTIIKTLSGRFYKVMSGSESGRESNPEILVLRNGTSYNLLIEGYDELFGAKLLDCQKTLIQDPSPFKGNAGETIVLADSSVWILADVAVWGEASEASPQFLFLDEYFPAVIICPYLGPTAIMFVGEHRFSLVQKL